MKYKGLNLILFILWIGLLYVFVMTYYSTCTRSGHEKTSQSIAYMGRYSSDYDQTTNICFLCYSHHVNEYSQFNCYVIHGMVTDNVFYIMTINVVNFIFVFFFILSVYCFIQTGEMNGVYEICSRIFLKTNNRIILTYKSKLQSEINQIDLLIKQNIKLDPVQNELYNNANEKLNAITSYGKQYDEFISNLFRLKAKYYEIACQHLIQSEKTLLCSLRK